MSVEITLKDLLDPLVDGGCHNGVNNNLDSVSPYVVFHEINGVPVVGISVPYLGITRYRYQVEVFATSMEMAKALAVGVVRDAIQGSVELQGTMMFQAAGQYSEVTKMHQYITEYEIWAK